jgi:hypothetical protein
VLAPRDGYEGQLITDFAFYNTSESALEEAHRRIETNPGGVPFQVMSFDGYANLHTGRTDGLTIELRIYASGQYARQEALTMKIVCPYRNGTDAQGFAIYSPKLLECSAPAAMHAAIFKDFYLGLQKFKVNDFEWSRYLDERI